jgi:hypothetical protein
VLLQATVAAEEAAVLLLKDSMRARLDRFDSTSEQ